MELESPTKFPEVTLEIQKGQNDEQRLFRVSKGALIKIKEGPSLYGFKVSVFTNAPLEKDTFKRQKYRLLKNKELITYHAGSFHYYFTIGDSEKVNGEGYISVEPELKIGDQVLELDGIQCVTYLSKCMGPIGTWMDKLAVAKASGYNMVHFTPIQELGGSKSGYCLKDQLKINPEFQNDPSTPIECKDIEKVLNTMKTEWKMLTICDIVLNHSANESPWLQKHPECAYNLENSPHLRPAYVLDVLLYKLSLAIADGSYELVGLPAKINNEDHLNSLCYHLGSILIPSAKIADMFLVDVNDLVREFQERSRFIEPTKLEFSSSKKLKIIQDPQYRRLKSSVDMDLALDIYNIFRGDCYDEDTRLRRCAEAFKACIESLNNEIREEVENHLKAAVDNTIATVRYFRLDSKGPKIPKVTSKDLLVPRYFHENLGLNEESMYTDEAKFIMAHNGWVMDYDPLKNFAEPGTNIYLRRELIAWGDSVKLRYGKKREDCPYLWDHMKKYVETTAKLFDGVRLDNCHSTPIPVAQYLLDAARLIKPELYIVAELFTNSDNKDNVFVNKLGITSLIRECMSGWNSHEVGRLVYRYGGDVIGALDSKRVSKIAHALFMDLTHDNPSPVERRTVYDFLPSTALVSMAACATGSTMGYDQLVPHHIHVVNEERQYMCLSETKLMAGIMKAKLALNNLHLKLSRQGYHQVFVDQIDQDIVCVTRFNPITLKTVVLVAYTAFNWPEDHQTGQGRGVTVIGVAKNVILEAYISHKSGKRFVGIENFKKHEKIINGLDEYELHLRENVDTSKCNMGQLVITGQTTRFNFTNQFRPGSVLAVEFAMDNLAEEAVSKISEEITFDNAIEKLSLADINYALYRSGSEEEGGGSYNVPGHGLLVYCGVQGAMSVLSDIATNNDLGHPLCSNVREGSWLAGYMASRLKKHPPTEKLGEILEARIKYLDKLPASLKPWGLYKILSQIHSALIVKATTSMPKFVKDGNELIQRLALCSVQLAGIVQSAPLPPLSKHISAPAPQVEILTDGTEKQLCVTLAAGLPHFASGYMRSWGRDTFIALRGLLLLTGRFDEARYHILGYAGCLRHGLIPNLLFGGLKARYNCRDAIWWWLYSIKEYTKLAPNGTAILKDKVNRIYPTDEADPVFIDQELHEVMQEAFSVHFQGLCFRERNAGREIDEHMTSAGFDNQIGVQPTTGFVFGGNEWNCGTWMDKMGSSVEAGTKGKPATPRDGSAIEIIGLSYSVIIWLNEIWKDHKYPHRGVTRINKAGMSTFWSWKDWASKIKTNFTNEFWVPLEENNNLKYVNRRGIYKDTAGATQPWADFRLRPNFTIAMVVAPELFDKEKAIIALKNAKILEGPLGMKTLDPSDLVYCGDYDNSNNSSDYRIAHGFNYHQGPEWVWLTGYYLRALLHFTVDIKSSLAKVERYLSTHLSHIKSSHWRGLPELTNKDGAFCSGSCTTQAWSAGTILEVLHDIEHIKEKIS